MKRIFVLTLMIFALQTIMAQSEGLKKLDEKYGYKDLQFEMTYPQLKNYLSAKPISENEEEKTKAYNVTKEDFLKVSKYTIKSIEAYFYDGKLYMLKLYLEGAFNSGGFFDILERAYGKGNQVEMAPHKAKWQWIGTKVLLSFDKRSYGQDTEVIFECEKLSRERRDFIENYGLDDL